jgi:DNA segregation ATPase FtsK/SpoIIIE, S-DNA-T family
MTITTEFVPTQHGPEASNGHAPAEVIEKIAPPPAKTPEIPKPKGGELRPLLAPWLRSRSVFIATAMDAGHRAGHSTLWHMLHSPLHAARLLKYTPRGSWKVTRALWAWTLHTETRLMQREHALVNNSPEWLKLEKERKEAVHRRWIAMAVMSGLVVITLLLWWWLMPRWLLFPGWGPFPDWVLTPWWTFSLTSFFAALGLGWHGRPRDGKPVLARATSVAGNPPLRSETVVNALCALGIGAMKDPEQIRLVHDLTNSAGYLFELELPAGVTAEAVMEKRSQLSAALRRPLGCVWPSVGPRHEGHLVLFVCHKAMNEVKQAKWPLMKSGVVDIFQPQPLFTDQRNQWIKLTLAYTSGVIGALPRMGKTRVLRQKLLVAALDPRVKIYAFDFKGTGDLSPLRLVAHRYACTARPEKIKELLPMFEELQQEMFRRAEVIEGLTYDECPDSKVTPELASRRGLGLEPIFVGVDECHELFEHEDDATRNRFVKIFTDLVKRGPALGIMVYLSTQKPSATSIPTAISDNAVIRVCLKVHGQRANDAVLGTEAHKTGIKATMFALEDKGIAYIKGEESEAQVGRSVSEINAPTAEMVAKRARTAREAAGRLTGDAAGVAMEVEAEEVLLLDDCRTVMAGAEAMHLTDLATGLATLRPGQYPKLDANGLGKLLRGLTPPVEPSNVWVSGKSRERGNAKGIKREQLDISTTSEVAGEEPESAN